MNLELRCESYVADHSQLAIKCYSITSGYLIRIKLLRNKNLATSLEALVCMRSLYQFIKFLCFQLTCWILTLIVMGFSKVILLNLSNSGTQAILPGILIYVLYYAVFTAIFVFLDVTLIRSPIWAFKLDEKIVVALEIIALTLLRWFEMVPALSRLGFSNSMINVEFEAFMESLESVVIYNLLIYFGRRLIDGRMDGR